MIQTTYSAFGGLHSALVGLSAKICGPQDFIASITPSNDLEREEDQTLVLALRDNGTIFTDKVDSLVENLEAALLTYQSTATSKRAGSNAFRPVLLPNVRVGENAAAGTSFHLSIAPSFLKLIRFSAIGQNLGSAASFLRDTAQILEERLSDSKTLSEMVENFDSRPLDEIEDVSSFSPFRHLSSLADSRLHA